MRRRKETLLGQLEQAQSGVPMAAPDYSPVRRYALLAAGVGGVFLVAYALLGFFFAPWLIKHLLPEEISQRYPVEVDLGRVSVNPFTFTVVLRDLRIRDVEGGDALGADRLLVNFQVSSLVREGLHFRKIGLDAPEANLVWDSAGNLNLLALFSGDGEVSPASADGNLPVIHIHRAQVESGVVRLRDQQLDEHFSTEIRPISFSVDGFTTAPLRRGGDGSFALRAEGRDGFVFQTEGRMETHPFQMGGSVLLENLGLHHYNLYWRNLADLEVEEGSLNLAFDFTAERDEAGPWLRLERGVISLARGRLRLAGTEQELLSAEEVSLSGLTADTREKRINLEDVRLSGGTLRLTRDSAGDWSLPAAELAADRGYPGRYGDPPGWSWEIREIAVSAFVLEGEDRKAGAHFPQLVVDALRVAPLSNDFEQMLALELEARLGERGQISMAGDAVPASRLLRADLLLEAIPMSWASPYLEEQRSARLKDGEFNLRGRVETETTEEGAGLSLQGENARFSGLSIEDTELPGIATELARLELESFQIQSSPLHIEGKRLLVSGLQTTVVRGADDRWQLPGGGRRSEPSAPVDEGKGDARGYFLALAEIILEESGVTLLDSGPGAETEFNLTGLQGLVTGLSPDPGSRAELELQGTVNGVAPWRIDGSGFLFDPRKDLELTLSLQPMSVTLANPYATRYLGRRLSRGNLRLNLEYTVDDHALAGRNRIVVDQLALGERVPTDDLRIQFPLGLAVAALQDSRGVIDLDVDVSGRLDDPGFRLGGVVMRAIFNLMARAATAPFSVLANLVGSSEELSHVTFEPGKAELTESAHHKLDQLAQALSQRPRLSLEFSALGHPELDREALLRETLYRRLAALQEREADAPQGDFLVDPEIYKELLQRASGILPASPVVPRPAPPEERAAHLPTEELEVARVERAPGFLARFLGLGGTAPPEPAATPTPRPLPERPARSAEVPVVSLEFPEEPPPVDELEAELLREIEVSPGELRRLARDRVAAVKNFLETQGAVSEDRLFVVDSDGEAAAGESPQVVFQITSR